MFKLEIVHVLLCFLLTMWTLDWSIVCCPTAMDAYVKIICEGEKVQSSVVSDDKNPKFGTKATYYRKKPDVPIIVEV